MVFQLRERNRPTLEDMQSVAVSVEANLLAKELGLGMKGEDP